MVKSIASRTATLLIAVAASVISTHASAHAALTSAEPGVDATLASAPSEIHLTFSEALEVRFSSIHVVDALGHRVDAGSASADANDDAQLHLALAKLSAGHYTVQWSALSKDGHRTRGSYGFTVR
jgi:methionine-rich copper-binding protein CopC